MVPAQGSASRGSRRGSYRSAGALLTLRQAGPPGRLRSPPSSRRAVLLRLISLLILFGIGMPAATAQTKNQVQDAEALINWYYAAVFGTGVYTTGDRTVAVLQIPFAYTLQPYSPGHPGVRLTVPVSFGFYDFSLGNLAHGDIPESVSTASILPGVELETYVLDNWQLKPFAAVGQGWELTGDASALLFHVGLKSRLTFPMGRGQFMLGNLVSYASYEPEHDVSHPLTRFITGFNFIFPSNGTVMGRPVDFGLHLMHYLYGTHLDFPTVEDVDNTTRQEIEVGFSFSIKKPVSVGALGQNLFDFDQIGMAFRVGDNVTAVRLFFSLPY